MDSVIELRGIVKRFGTTLANDQVDFDLRSGEVHALLGENGAGKTTLMRVLFGLYQPNAGRIIVRGKECSITTPKDAIGLGIGMVHQQFMLIPTLTVAENIVLGTRIPHEPMLDLRQTIGQLQEMSTSYGLSVNPNALISDLSVGARQRVEIVKALCRGAEIIILDEPTSVLTPQESTQLFDVIRTMCDEGKSVVYISHKLDEVMRISDRVTVLRDGHVVGTCATNRTSTGELAEMMVGRSVFFSEVHVEANAGSEALKVENLEASGEDNRHLLKDISFHVYSGEMLGVAGVAGNGQSELVEILSGLREISHGRVIIGGKNLTNKPPSDFIAAGVGHIAEDREERGLVEDATLTENLILGRHAQAPFSHFGMLNLLDAEREAERLLNEFDIRPPEPSIHARSLSGGNKQKLVLARELAKEPQLLIAAHPTRGLDVGATEYVRRLLIQQKKMGCAVLLVSTDLDEIMILSDRIAVLYEGRLMGIVIKDKATRELLGLMMAGIHGNRTT